MRNLLHCIACCCLLAVACATAGDPSPRRVQVHGPEPGAADEARAASDRHAHVDLRDGQRPGDTRVERREVADPYIDMVSGDDFTCAMRRSLQIDCWGRGTATWQLPSAQQGDLLVAGRRFACIHRGGNGMLDCFGDDPPAPPPTAFTALTLAVHHGCGTDGAGAVVCWGEDRAGETNAPQRAFTSMISGRLHTCGLRPEGSVECWGEASLAVMQVPEDTEFVELVGGDDYACGRDRAGAVQCWGFGRAGETRPTDEVVASLTGSRSHACGLLDTGVVRCWGLGSDAQTEAPGQPLTPAEIAEAEARAEEEGEPVPPMHLERPFVRVAPGTRHTCAIRDDGTARCWGHSYHGQAQSLGSRGTQIAVGDAHTCILRSTGSVLCWGDGGGERVHGRIGGNYTAVVAGAGHGCAYNEALGGGRCWGSRASGEDEMPDNRLLRFAPGRQASCVIYRRGRRLECWGRTDRDLNRYPTDGEFVDVALGDSHGCAIEAGGRIRCWGDSLRGQLQAPDLRATQVSAGVDFTCAIAADGGTRCWGDDSYGQLEVPAGSRYTHIDCGAHHCCGHLESRQVQCWGDDGFGQASPPDIPMIGFSAGGAASCGLNDDGRPLCWATYGHDEAL